MNPLEDLKAEHRGIETALGILTRIVGSIEKPESPDAINDAQMLIEFFSGFADTCHHGKEEEFLFPALEQIGVSREGGPIGVMLAEHARGRRYIKEMRAALKELKSGDKEASAAFRNAAKGYVDLLTRHIEKEDNVLFEIAANKLSKVRLTEMADEFERLEKEKIGPGRHEAYHALLESMAKKYLQTIPKSGLVQ